MEQYSSGRKNLQKLGIIPMAVPDPHPDGTLNVTGNVDVEGNGGNKAESSLLSLTESEKHLLFGQHSIDVMDKCEQWLMGTDNLFSELESGIGILEGTEEVLPAKRTDLSQNYQSEEVERNSTSLDVSKTEQNILPKKEVKEAQNATKTEPPQLFPSVSKSDQSTDDEQDSICSGKCPKLGVSKTTPKVSSEINAKCGDLSNSDQGRDNDQASNVHSVIYSDVSKTALKIASKRKEEKIKDDEPVPAKRRTPSVKSDQKNDDWYMLDYIFPDDIIKNADVSEPITVEQNVLLERSDSSVEKLKDVNPNLLLEHTHKSKPATDHKVKRKLTFSNLKEMVRSEAAEELGSNSGRKRRTRIVVENADSLNPKFYEEEVTSDDDNRSSNCGFSDGSKSEDKNHDFNAGKNDIGTETPSTSTQVTTPSTTTKKRKYKPLKNSRRRQYEESEKAKKKRAYNAGLEYATEKGKLKKARVMGPGCRESCKKCEKPRISEEDRQKHFEEYWALPSAEKKWDYVSRLVSRHEPKSLNTLKDRAKRFMNVHKLKSNGTLVQVCKQMFLQTFQINASVVETALKKVNEKGSITPDKRGSHAVRPNQNTESQKASVRRHIDQIERVPSHYTRARTKKEYYFEAGLSFDRLFKMYVEWAKDVGLPNEEIATKSCYHEIFMTEYNIGFHEPLNDQCVVHARWRTGTKEERQEMFEEYKKHLFNYNHIKKKKKEEKEYAATDDTFCLACFDLEKVLTLPRSNISVMFYLTKLSLYNFTIYDLISKKGVCCMWDETVASRGANEVSSNMLRFIVKMSCKGKKVFVFYSDSPTGQNKNRMVFSLWLYAAVKYGIDITHRFFESGHSFSEVDNMHGNIEREAKKKEIFHPDQWVEVISSAIQEGETYEIDHLTAENCLNFHKLVSKLTWKKDTRGEQINWTLVKEVRASHHHPDTIFFRYGYNEEEERSIIVNPEENCFDIATYQFEQAVHEPIPLTQKKAADLSSLLKKKIIPAQFRDFYRNLPGMGEAA